VESLVLARKSIPFRCIISVSAGSNVAQREIAEWLKSEEAKKFFRE